VTPEERGWLAGLLEGEGTFAYSRGTPVIVLTMIDEDIVRRAAALMGSPSVRRRHHNARYQPTYTARLSGRCSVDLMRELEPLLGHRRGGRIRELLALYGDRYVDRVCGGCGKIFRPSRSLQYSCSRRCWHIANRPRQQELRRIRTRSARGVVTA